LKQLAEKFVWGWLTLLLVSLAGIGLGKDLPNYPKYTHIAKEEPIDAVIKSFASNLGYPVVISAQVRGSVNGRFSDTPNPFLNRLASIYNLSWYFDGSRLYVYAGEEVENTIIRAQYIGINQLKRSMLELGILDHKSIWRSIPARRIAYISGPPRFVKLAQEMTQVLDTSRPRGLSGDLTVEVFTLKYALAYDRTYESRGQKHIVKGIASVLKGIVMGTQVPLQTVVNNPSVPSLTPMGGAQAAGQPAQVVKGNVAGDAFIEGNRHLNAVIVRDRSENMDMYARLIDKLDIELEQVEINVSIIDISTDHLDRLGVEWQYDGKDASVSRGTPSSDIASTEGLPSPTIISGGAKEFMGRIQMLSQNGNAKVLSRPSVLTVDKSEAIIDSSSTFHVRVAGKESAELFPVSVGTLMRVTPRVVDDKDNRWIHLDVSIEDGKQNQETVDDIPVIKKSTINTRAVVAQKSSLLVGGYYYNRNANTDNKIPLLGNIPIIGPLFNWSESDSARMVRMFLISPRILAKKEASNQLTPSDIETIYEKVEKFEVPNINKKVDEGAGK